MSIATYNQALTNGSAAANVVQLGVPGGLIPAQDIGATVVINATGITGLVVLFEGSVDFGAAASPTWVPLGGQNLSTGSFQSSASGITGIDSAINSWLIPFGGTAYKAIRVRQNGALTGGSPSVSILSTSFMPVITNIPAGSIGATTTFADGANLVFGTSTGTEIGTGATQKLAFYGATPIVQPANTVDYVTMLTNLGLRATGGTAAATFPGAVVATSLTSATSTGSGIGYATGAGGAVTQASSRTTTVVLSKLAGAITLFSAAGSATPATFTVTNTTVAATDTIVVSQKSGTDAYSATVSAVAAGSFKLTIADTTGTTTEAPVFNFAVLKSVAS